MDRQIRRGDVVVPRRQLAIDGSSVVYRRDVKSARSSAPIEPRLNSPAPKAASSTESSKPSQIQHANNAAKSMDFVVQKKPTLEIKQPTEPQPQPQPIKKTEPETKEPVEKRSEEPKQPKDKAKKAKKSKSSKSAKRKFTLRKLLVGVTVLAILSVTGYVSYDAWQTNTRTKQILGESSSPESSALPSQHRQEQEGKDRKPLPADTLKNYKVAADLPRAVFIDKINAKGRLLPMGVNRDSTMQAPINIYDGGWYNGSAKPGQIGASVLVGHASENNSGDGLFGKLYRLKLGDIVTVEMGDGSKQKYKVVETETVPEDKVDMGKLLLPHGKATKGVNLITCAGSWIGNETMDHRLIVYTLPV
ncbi:hypothetical protein CR969_00110 [Candidatus Saccharibacteria bacterium]|nr:MAG: hypothetical protein CR969_00110 [Candidatus Saccharibacteria bacterium]